MVDPHHKVRNWPHEQHVYISGQKGFGHSHSAKRGKVSYKASYKQQTRHILETASR
jgi:hypothetical protein